MIKHSFIHSELLEHFRPKSKDVAYVNQKSVGNVFSVSMINMEVHFL